jgi:hypothetical protein
MIEQFSIGKIWVPIQIAEPEMADAGRTNLGGCENVWEADQIADAVYSDLSVAAPRSRTPTARQRRPASPRGRRHSDDVAALLQAAGMPAVQERFGVTLPLGPAEQNARARHELNPAGDRVPRGARTYGRIARTLAANRTYDSGGNAA